MTADSRWTRLKARGRRVWDPLAAFAQRFWKALVALVGLLVGITVLLTFVGLGPNPPTPTPTPTPTPAATGGEIEVTGLDPNRTLREHLKDVGLPTDAYTENELKRVGNVFDVSVVIKGYQGQEIPLRWTMRDAVADVELTEPEFNDQEADRFKPRSPEDRGTSRVWSPIPRDPGTYEIELRLIAPDGSVLARTRGPEFETPGA
jgi:hypothetical protein